MYKPRIEVVFGNERITSPCGLNVYPGLGHTAYEETKDLKQRVFAFWR